MKKLMFACAATLSMVAACQNDEGVNNKVPKEYKPIELTEAQTRMASESTDFAFRFFQTASEVLGKEEQNKNKLILSPVSASYALSMAANGAEGATLTELIEVLGFSGFSIDEINAYNQKLVQELVQQDNTTLLSMANSLWLLDDFQVLSTYRNALKKNYDAEVRREERAKAKDAINAWCADKTNGCIPDFLKDDPEGKALLLNALYFKGLWAEPFDKGLTQNEPFTNEDGTQTEVAMLNRQSGYLLAQNDLYATVRLPYGNGAFALQVILPQEGVSLAQCIEALNGASWQALQESMMWKEVDVKLPKFTIEDYQNSLIRVLMAMGVQEAFRNSADFSKMANKDLMISSVDQSVYFRLDEEGTEAAAVTGIGMSQALPQSPYGVYEFHVDRPFLFLLTEKSTDSVLFMGQVTEF